MNFVAYLLIVVGCAYFLTPIFLLLYCGRWLNQRASLVSPYWVGAWVILTTIHGLVNPFIVGKLEGDGVLRAAGGWARSEFIPDIVRLTSLASLLQSLSLFALFILVLAEVLHLARGKAIEDGEGWLIQRIAGLWTRRHALGATSILLLIAGACTRWALTASLYGS